LPFVKSLIYQSIVFPVPLRFNTSFLRCKTIKNKSSAADLGWSPIQIGVPKKETLIWLP